MSKDCRSKETTELETSEEGLTETRCIDMASIDLNALGDCSDGVPEDGGGRLPGAPNARQSKELQAGVKQASAGSWCAKGVGQAQRRVSSGREPSVADTHRALKAMSEMNDMVHDVFFPWSDRGIKAHAYHEGSGTKLQPKRMNGVFELPARLVLSSQSTSKNNNSGTFSSLSALEQIEDMMVKIAKGELPY